MSCIYCGSDDHNSYTHKALQELGRLDDDNDNDED